MSLRPIEILHRQSLPLRGGGTLVELCVGGPASTCVRALLSANRELRPDHKSLRVVYKLTCPSTVNSSGTGARLGFNRRSAEIQEIIEGALLSLDVRGPNLKLSIDVTSADGSTRAWGTNTGMLSLLDAGLCTESTFVATIGRINGQFVTDLDYVTDSQGDLDMNLGLKVDAQGNVLPQVTLLQVEGTVSRAQFDHCVQLLTQIITSTKESLWHKVQATPALTFVHPRLTPGLRGAEPSMVALTRTEISHEDATITVVYAKPNVVRIKDAYGNDVTVSMTTRMSALEPMLNINVDSCSELSYDRWSRQPCLYARLIDRLLRTYLKPHEIPPVEGAYAAVDVNVVVISGVFNIRLIGEALRLLYGSNGLVFPTDLVLNSYVYMKGALKCLTNHDERFCECPILYLFKNGADIVLLQKQGIGSIPLAQITALL